jgi:hypothetical protein
MEYRILTSGSPSGLSTKVGEFIKDGWRPVGGHQVIEIHRQNRYSGSQHMDTRIKVEYSQTMIKDN